MPVPMASAAAAIAAVAPTQVSPAIEPVVWPCHIEPRSLSGNPDVARQNILLPRIDEATVGAARELVALVEKTPSDLNQSVINLGNRASAVTLIPLLERHVPGVYGNGINRTQAAVLAILFLYRDGSWGRLPGFTRGTNPHSEAYFRTIVRFCLVNEGLATTARDLETLKFVRTNAATRKLKVDRQSFPRSLAQNTPIHELIEIAFPGITGENVPTVDPIVRSWLLNSSTKFEGLEGATRVRKACRWLLEVAEPVYDPTTKAFDLRKIEETSWLDVAKANHLPVLYIAKTLTSADIVRIGAAELGETYLVGWRKDQVASWKLTSVSMWHPLRGVIDNLSERIIADIEEEHPYDRDWQPLSPEKAKSINDWPKRYNRTANFGLRNSKLSVPQALARVRPDWFGLESGKLWLWDFELKPNFGEADQRDLARDSIVVALARAGVGELNLRSFIYNCNRTDLEQFFSAGKLISTLSRDTALEFVFRAAPIHGDARRAIRILFGLDPSTTDLDLSLTEQELFLELLKYEGESLRVSVRRIESWSRAIENIDRDEKLGVQLAETGFEVDLSSTSIFRPDTGFSLREQILLWKLQNLKFDGTEEPYPALHALTSMVFTRNFVPIVTDDDIVDFLRFVARRIVPKLPLSGVEQESFTDRIDQIVLINNTFRHPHPSNVLKTAIQIRLPEDKVPKGVSFLSLLDRAIAEMAAGGPSDS